MKPVRMPLTIRLRFLYWASLLLPCVTAPASAADPSQSTPTPVVSVFGSPLLLNFGYHPAGTITTGRPVGFSCTSITNPLVLTVPPGFELSKDNQVFATTLVYTPAELISQQTCFIRFAPQAANTGFGGSLLFTTTGFSRTGPDLSASSLHPDHSLDVVNWNIAWFGGVNGPVNLDLQVENARIVMDSLGADLYMLQEIVDTARLGLLTRSLLNGPYDYIVASYASNTTTNTNTTWRNAQKLAYVYRRSLFSNIHTRGYTSSAGNTNRINWASGRYPFLMDAQVTVNGITKRVLFFNIHAKAELGETNDYFRRLGAANLLYDSLTTMFPTQHLLVAGDFNDDLDETISKVAGTTLPPYFQFMEDSVNYTALSYWNTLRGENSFIGFPNVVDHAIASNEMALDYHAYSCILRREALNWVNQYRDSLTDHLPLVSRFDWRQSALNQVTSLRRIPETAAGLQLSGVPGPQPRLWFRKTLPGPVYLQVRTLNGQLLWQQQLGRVNEGQQVMLPLHHLPSGLYLLEVSSREGRSSLKLVR